METSMKKLLASAAFVAMAAASGAAFAASQGITMGATVNGGVTMPSVLQSVTGNATMNGNTGVTVTNFTDNQGFSTTQPFTFGFGVASSGVKVSFTLTSANNGFTLGNLNPPDPANAGFTNRVHYLATPSWDAWAGVVNAALTTTGTTNGPVSGPTKNSAGPVSGNLSVTVTPQATTLPVQAGTYGDTLTVTILPL
jgi:hypothetical protein